MSFVSSPQPAPKGWRENTKGWRVAGGGWREKARGWREAGGGRGEKTRGVRVGGVGRGGGGGGGGGGEGESEGVEGGTADDRATLPATGSVAVRHGAGGEVLSGD